MVSVFVGWRARYGQEHGPPSFFFDGVSKHAGIALGAVPNSKSLFETPRNAGSEFRAEK